MDDNDTAVQVSAQASLVRVKYGSWVIICGLIAVMLAFIGAMIVFMVSPAILKPTASDVISVVSTVVSEVGIIVGTFFGVQVGTAGKESIDTKRAEVTSKGIGLATASRLDKEKIKVFLDAVAEPSIKLSSLLPGCLVPLIVVIAAPLVGFIIGLATSIQTVTPILVTALTIVAGTISTIAGVLVGIWAGNAVKKSAEEARKKVVQAFIDLSLSVASQATQESPPLVQAEYLTAEDKQQEGHDTPPPEHGPQAPSEVMVSFDDLQKVVELLKQNLSLGTSSRILFGGIGITDNEIKLEDIPKLLKVVEQAGQPSPGGVSEDGVSVIFGSEKLPKYQGY